MSQVSIRQLTELSYPERTAFGDKAVRLAQIQRSGLPVPPAFVVGEPFFRRFTKAAKLDRPLQTLFRRLHSERPKELAITARRIQDLIVKTPLPAKLTSEFERAYASLVDSDPKSRVAVRSSLVEAVLPDSRFYGQQVSFLGIRGPVETLSAVKHTWAAFFEPKAVAERLLHETHVSDLPVGVIVQVFVEASLSGLTASYNPVTGNPGETVTEAIRGASLPLTEGVLEPSQFVWDANSNSLLDATIEAQSWALVAVPESRGMKFEHQMIAREQTRSSPVSDELLKVVSQLALEAAALWHAPVILEWVASASGEIQILRVELQLAENGLSEQPADSQNVLLSGASLQIGIASGPARIIRRPGDLDRVRAGEVLILEVPSISWQGVRQHVAAIVAEGAHPDQQLRTDCAAFGIPTVVGRRATAHIPDGMVITVDGLSGRVSKGAVRHQNVGHHAHPGHRSDRRTKVFLSIGRDRIPREILKEVDGIGLVKGNEFITAHGFHPRFLLEEQRGHQLSHLIAKRLHELATQVPQLPLIYRFSDLPSHHARQMTGGDKIEARERNPLLGYRGGMRFVREPDLFALELAGLHEARQGYGLLPLAGVVPFVRTPAEWTALRRAVSTAGLGPETGFRLWLSIDLPVNLWQIDDYLREGVDGLSIDLDQLTQLLFGLDHENARLSAYQLHADPVLVTALCSCVAAAHERGIPVLLTIDRLPISPALLAPLIHSGITGFTVAPSQYQGTAELVSSIERHALYEAIAKTVDGGPHPFW